MRILIILMVSICFPVLFTACESENKEELFPKDLKDTVDVCPTVNMSFSMDINPIIVANCAFSGCHGENSIDGDFTTYQGIKNKIDNGDLIRNEVVTRKKMPKNATLPDCEIDKIESWLNAGAPNN